VSLYLNLLTASINEGSASVILRDVRHEHLLEEEVTVHEFAINHYRRYRTLPSPEILTRQGIRLPTISEGATYYLDELRKRYVYNVINSNMEDFREAMGSRNPDGAIDIWRQVIRDLGSELEDGPSQYRDVVAQVVEQYDQIKFIGGLSGVTFGWGYLDEITMGAQGGDIDIIVGRPNVGKSYVMFESAYQAWLAGHSISLESLEMGKVQMVRRFMGRHLGINPNFIRKGKLSAWTETMMRNYHSQIEGMPAFHIGSGNMKKGISAIEGVMQEFLPDCMYVDSAYLLSPEGKKTGYLKRWEQMQESISQLKEIAVRYDRPMLLTVQFGKQLKDGGDKTPDLGDISGSDSVAQDASLIIGLRRGLPPYEAIRRRMIIMKHREGSLGEFEINFRFDPPDFSEVSEDPQEQLSWMV
jgi:replicative DNA helicase